MKIRQGNESTLTYGTNSKSSLTNSILGYKHYICTVWGPWIMVLDHKIIIFWWSCDQFLQDHQNKWSHGYDLVFFMISWFWSWRFHDLLPQNPWFDDPTHGNSMIRWSHSPNFHDPVIALSEIQPHDPVISLAKTKILWSGDLCIYFL